MSKTNMEIRTLEGVSVDRIHDAFSAAFSDYAVSSAMSSSEFQEFLVTRSFSAEHSLGAFQDGNLIGFALTGFRVTQDSRTGYDVATGIRPELRRQGVGSRLLEELLARTDGWAMDRFVLEVLTGNEGAQSLYERHGFRIRRRFRCFRKEFGPTAAVEDSGPDPADLAFLQTVDEVDWLGFEPAWQNSLASFRNAAARHGVKVWREGGEVLGYGIVHRERGSLLQIGIAPGRWGAVPIDSWFRQLAGVGPSGRLSAVNMEAGCVAEHLFEEAGFAAVGDQWEMVLERHR